MKPTLWSTGSEGSPQRLLLAPTPQRMMQRPTLNPRLRRRWQRLRHRRQRRPAAMRTTLRRPAARRTRGRCSPNLTVSPAMRPHSFCTWAESPASISSAPASTSHSSRTRRTCASSRGRRECRTCYKDGGDFRRCFNRQGQPASCDTDHASEEFFNAPTDVDCGKKYEEFSGRPVDHSIRVSQSSSGGNIVCRAEVQVSTDRLTASVRDLENASLPIKQG